MTGQGLALPAKFIKISGFIYLSPTLLIQKLYYKNVLLFIPLKIIILSLSTVTFSNCYIVVKTIYCLYILR